MLRPESYFYHADNKTYLIYKALHSKGIYIHEAIVLRELSTHDGSVVTYLPAGDIGLCNFVSTIGS